MRAEGTFQFPDAMRFIPMNSNGWKLKSSEGTPYIARMEGYFQPGAQVYRMDRARHSCLHPPSLVLLVYLPPSRPIALFSNHGTASANLVVDSTSVMISVDFCDPGQAHYFHLLNAPHQ